MLSYRHAFHAGNFADVVKHTVLQLIVDALLKKDAAFCYIDTHSGSGAYDLHGAPARKTHEYRDGIARLWTRTDVPPLLASYIDIVRAFNTAAGGGDELRYYPGSPRIVRTMLRPQDRMVLMELHTTEVPLLKQEFAGDRQVGVHHVDGFVGLKGFVPPPERRGVVLMDPSYEIKSDFDHVVRALAAAYERWPTGIYALWYPVLDRALVNRLERQLSATSIKKILLAELCIRPDNTGGGLNGCGMVVINPPWMLDGQLSELLPWLRDALAVTDSARQRVVWLARE